MTLRITNEHGVEGLLSLTLPVAACPRCGCRSLELSEDAMLHRSLDIGPDGALALRIAKVEIGTNISPALACLGPNCSWRVEFWDLDEETAPCPNGCQGRTAEGVWGDQAPAYCNVRGCSVERPGWADRETDAEEFPVLTITAPECDETCVSRQAGDHDECGVGCHADELASCYVQEEDPAAVAAWRSRQLGDDEPPEGGDQSDVPMVHEMSDDERHPYLESSDFWREAVL